MSNLARNTEAMQEMLDDLSEPDLKIDTLTMAELNAILIKRACQPVPGDEDDGGPCE